jgi:wobble nucleotide-excising tRNase
VVNNQPVAVAGGTAPAGQPSFRTVLSAGDRNTLALAFFFASLDQDPNLASKIVVIDDPVSSLDEHRTLTTVQEIRNLVGRTAQVIILSHSKAFLCNIWDHMAPTLRGALQLVRDGDASRIEPWDVTRDMVTAHDRRHELLRGYLTTSTANNRPVADALRPVLEAFLRVAYPGAFPPGTMLANFRNHCQQLLATPRQILDQADITELRALTEYGNQFHHDTNPAWQTQHT